MTTHTWTFQRCGGNDQVVIEGPDDLAHIGTLDQQLWAALACPVEGLELDADTLRLIDTNNDGRVRAEELIAAVAWMRPRLASFAPCFVPGDRLAATDLHRTNGEGLALAAAMADVRTVLALPADAPIGLDEVARARAAIHASDRNGDGVVPPAACRDDAAAGAIVAWAVAAGFAADDLAGAPGAGPAQLDAAMAAARAWLAWHASRPALPLDDEAAVRDAHAAVSAVAAKVDDFFARCALAAFDPGLTAAVEAGLDGDERTRLARDLVDPAAVERLPLARIAPGAALPRSAGVHPAWSDRIAALFLDAVQPFGLGADTLDASGWRALRARLSACSAWIEAEPPVPGPRDPATLLALIDGPGPARLQAIQAEDAAASARLAAIDELGRLVRLRRDLLVIARNFVSFADFYASDRDAVFQSGTLLLDGRRFTLCVRILDRAKHEPLAAQARCCLAYCDLVRSGERRTVAVAITNGDSEQLTAGRNGIFYDRQGRDWDATVVKLIEHPISIRQAFFDPYKRAIRLIEDLVLKRAAGADADAAKGLADATTTAAKEPKKPKFDLSIIAVIGVVISGIAATIGGLMQAFFGLGMWMPLGLLGLILLISGPSMAIAWWKLRSRSLGPILDACGWAVNARIRITIPLGHEMTRLPRLPAGAQRRMFDRFAERRTPWRRWMLLAIMLGLGGWTLWHHHCEQRWWWQNAEKPPTAPAKPVTPLETPSPS